MKFIIHKNILINAISKVNVATSPKTLTPILQGIYFKCSNSKLTLIGSSNDITIKTKIPCNSIESGEIVVDANFLCNIVRKLPETFITLYVLENTLYIEYEESLINIPIMNLCEYPALPEEEIFEEILIKESSFKKMIRETIFSVGIDESRLFSTGALINVEDGSLDIVTIDNSRLSMRKSIINNCTSKKALVPGKNLNEVQKILCNEENSITITISDNHLIINLEDTIIYLRLLEQEFINYESVIPKTFSTEVTIDTNSFLGSLERAMLIGKESHSSKVIFEIKDQSLFIMANSSFGKVKEKISISQAGDNLKIAFNAKYFLDVIKNTSSDQLVMRFNGNINPCVISLDNKDDGIYLIMPVLI